MTRVDVTNLKKNSISQLYAMKDQIDLEPEYQRQGELWTKYKKQLFLDSILNGFDIPKLYLHDLQNPYKKDSNTIKYAVIDGRQRLETIWEFLDDENSVLGDNEILYRQKELNLKGYNYQQLSTEYPGLAGYFVDYPLPIMAVKTDDDTDEIIEDMFSRLNEAVSINAAEKRNAKQGYMIEKVRELASHEFFKTKVIFSNKRLQHHEVSVRLLFLEYCIRNQELVDTKKQYLDRFVDQFKEEEPSYPVFTDVSKIIDVMVENFENLDLLLKKQGRLLIYFLLYREALKQESLEKVKRERIISFNQKVKENNELAKVSEELMKFDLHQYDRYTIQGTNDASSIRLRFHIIAKHLGLSSKNIDDI